MQSVGTLTNLKELCRRLGEVSWRAVKKSKWENYIHFVNLISAIHIIQFHHCALEYNASPSLILSEGISDVFLLRSHCKI